MTSSQSPRDYEYQEQYHHTLVRAEGCIASCVAIAIAIAIRACSHKQRRAWIAIPTGVDVECSCKVTTRWNAVTSSQSPRDYEYQYQYHHTLVRAAAIEE